MAMGWVACHGAGAGGEGAGAQAPAAADHGARAGAAAPGASPAWRAHAELVEVRPTKPDEVLVLPARIALDEERTQRVGAPVDGRVTKVHAKVGDVVRAGQPLALLQAPAAGELQAQASAARAELALAEREVARLEMMHGEGAVSDRELLAARHEAARAGAQVAHAKAALANLGVGASAAPGRPPSLQVPLLARLGGRVVDRQITLGQEVRADAEAPLWVISDLAGVWATAAVFEAQAPQVAIGMDADVTVAAHPGRAFCGKVIAVGDVVQPTTRTVEVRVELANPDGALKPQMFAEVRLRIGAQADQIWLPAAAVLRHGADAHVLVVAGDAPARRPARSSPSVTGRRAGASPATTST